MSTCFHPLSILISLITGALFLFKMGQEQSSLIDEDVQPRSLCDRTLESIVKYIKDGRAKKIVVMVRRPSQVPFVFQTHTTVVGRP